MASRRADAHDSRYSAPRRYREDRRDRRRDDKYYDRDDKYYDRDRSRDRDDRRRGDRRDRDSYRRRSRTRSPLRRDRSRDRYDRRERDYDDHYDVRDRRDRRDDRRRSEDRPWSSKSATPAGELRPGSRAGGLSREEKQKREQEKQKQDAETAQKAKLARLEQWKKKQTEKQQAKKQTDSPAAASSPAATELSTPTVAPTPPASEAKQETAKAKATVKITAEKKPKQVKEPFKLDQSAAARPALFKAATKPSGPAVANRPTVPTSKTNGNIGAFGLKAKSAKEDNEPTKKALLDDEENTGKRSLQALPDFAPLEAGTPDAGDADEGAMSDIGSDDEENHAQLQAQLEKRREEMANETQMEEAPAIADDSGEKMDVDDAAGAQEEEIDPLDAFMAGLSEPHPNGRAPQGQTMFDDDNEPDLTAVEKEDILAMAAAKKKKKDFIVVDHKKVEYEPFRKNFYTEPAEVAQMTPEDVADLRHELDGIKVKPDNVPRPVTKWAQMGLLQQTMDVFAKVRYEKPTPIQAQSIPIAESGLDLMGVAKTGSGKTLAFGIPLIRHILDQRPLKPSDGPIGLIMAPTRELSLQIVNELKPFLKASGLHIACAYGGTPISEQIAMIKRGGIHVLVATPGRLIDLYQSNSGRVLNFKRVTYVVLDEADRMFDMGFEPQVVKILNNLRPDKQGIFFSATFPKNMAALARKYLKNPTEVIIGGRSVVAPDVTQIVELVPPSYDAKIKELLRQFGLLFQENENAQVLVFVERQETAEDLLSKLIKAKYGRVNTIHGAKDQTDRNEAINDFRQGELPILIATSVAARGLDVPGLAMVFNFDCPTHLEDYVHRCGRTGRAGNKGTAITLIENPGQERFAMHIVKALKQSGHAVPPEVEKMAKAFNEKIKSGEEKWYDPGFGGKGLDKLDAARAMERRREKRAHKIEGEDVSDDEPEVPLPKPEVKATNGEKATESVAEQPSYMQILSNKIVVNRTERPASTGPTKPMTAKERAMAAANKVDGRLSKKGMIHHGQPIDNKGPDAGAFHSTIEINDFPQKARWAVTNRTNVVKILDSTGVSITTKGNFYPPSKTPGETELPKLYILVEGDTENVVTAAMMEITRLLREATMSAEETTVRGPTGRYSVV